MKLKARLDVKRIYKEKDKVALNITVLSKLGLRDYTKYVYLNDRESLKNIKIFLKGRLKYG